MDQSKIKVDDVLTYFPPKKRITDNEHYPAKIVGEANKGHVKAIIYSADGHKKRSIPTAMLEAQFDLIGDIK